LQIQKTKPGYKIIKIGYGLREEIPNDWDCFKLEELVDEIKSGFASGKRDTKGIIQLRMNNITENGNFNFTKLLSVPIPKNIAEYKLEQDDILFNNTNSVELIGKSTIVKEQLDYTFSNHLTRIRTKTKKINPYFLLLNLIRFKQLFVFSSICNRHVNQSGITMKELLKLYVACPPLKEQQKISNYLSHIEDTIHNSNLLLKNLKILRHSLLSHTFNGSLTKNWRKKFSLSFPWTEKILSELILNSRNGFTGKPNDDGIGSPRLGIPSITNSDSIYVDENIHRFIEIEETKKSTFLVQKNDLLVCRQNGNQDFVGRTLMVRGLINPIFFSDSLIRLQIKTDEILPEYLVLFMNNMLGRNQIIRYITTTAGNYSINGTELKKLKIPLPTIKEQKHIVMILLNLDSQIQKEKIHKSNQELLKKGLMQKLLTGQIRVPL